MRVTKAESIDVDLIGSVEFIVHETGDDAGFSDRLISEKHQLVLC